MIDHEERVILEGLRRALSGELGIFRQLLELAKQKRAALVENKLEDLHILIEDENKLSDKGAEHRRIRDDLIRRLAQWRKLPKKQLTLSEMLDGVGNPLRAELEKLREELRQVLKALAETNEINQSLLRTALALVREVLTGVAGASQMEDYDRRGLSGEQQAPAVMNFFCLFAGACAPLCPRREFTPHWLCRVHFSGCTPKMWHRQKPIYAETTPRARSFGFRRTPLLIACQIHPQGAIHFSRVGTPMSGYRPFMHPTTPRRRSFGFRRTPSTSTLLCSLHCAQKKCN